MARLSRAQVVGIHILSWVGNTLKDLTVDIITNFFDQRRLRATYLSMVRGSPNPLHFGLPARLRKGSQTIRSEAQASRPEGGLRSTSYGEGRSRPANPDRWHRCPFGLRAWRQRRLVRGTGSANNRPTVQRPRLRAWERDSGAVALNADSRRSHLHGWLVSVHSTIANIEKGAQTGVDVLESLAKALGVSPAWLAFGEGPREIPKKRRVRTVRVQSAHADR